MSLNTVSGLDMFDLDFVQKTTCIGFCGIFGGTLLVDFIVVKKIFASLWEPDLWNLVSCLYPFQ